MVVNVIFHEGEAGCHLISVHGSIHTWSHDAADDGVLIEATKQLVVEVWVVRPNLVLHDQSALVQEFLLTRWFVRYCEIYDFFEFVGSAEINDWFVSLQCLFDVVESHLEEILQELTMVLFVDF